LTGNSHALATPPSGLATVARISQQKATTGLGQEGEPGDANDAAASRLVLAAGRGAFDMFTRARSVLAQAGGG